MTATLDPSVPTTLPLSELLRSGSHAEHRQAEGASFMTVLLAGELHKDQYGVYLSRLSAVYEALESVASGETDDPFARAVVDPALMRMPALAADLKFWVGPGSSAKTELSPATRAYVERIREATDTWGGNFLAHHYTRYLGDLSGGQAIGRILSRTYRLTDNRGVQFFDFPLIPKPKPYKDAYRARIDSLALSDRDKRRILDEVKVAFALNTALFDELGTDLGLSSRA